MNTEQLELFASPRSSSDGPIASAVTRSGGATMIVFPQDRNVGKARHVASVLATKGTHRAREAYWEQVVRGLHLSMRRAGFGRGEVEREVRRFHGAVSDELTRVGAAAGRN